MKATQFDIPNFDENNTEIFYDNTLVGKAVRCNSGRFSLTYIPTFLNTLQKCKFSISNGVEFTSIALRNQINKKVKK